jgi:hypothetical protein
VSEPALTAEEWNTGRLASVSASDIIVHDDGDGLEIVVYPDEAARDSRQGLSSKHKIKDWDTSARHGLAALALYGQTFGFTREDVKACRSAAARYAALARDAASTGSEVQRGAFQVISAQSASLADRIEALLPPEEPK